MKSHTMLDIERLECMTKMLDLFYCVLEIATSGEKLTEKTQQILADAFYKRFTVHEMLVKAIHHGGIDKFDWKQAHELGWLCFRDYSVFREELLAVGITGPPAQKNKSNTTT